MDGEYPIDSDGDDNGDVCSQDECLPCENGTADYAYDCDPNIAGNDSCEECADCGQTATDCSDSEEFNADTNCCEPVDCGQTEADCASSERLDSDTNCCVDCIGDSPHEFLSVKPIVTGSHVSPSHGSTVCDGTTARYFINTPAVDGEWRVENAQDSTCFFTQPISGSVDATYKDVTVNFPPGLADGQSHNVSFDFTVYWTNPDGSTDSQTYRATVTYYRRPVSECTSNCAGDTPNSCNNNQYFNYETGCCEDREKPGCDLNQSICNRDGQDFDAAN